jgi:hypothetical protein
MWLRSRRQRPGACGRLTAKQGAAGKAAQQEKAHNRAIGILAPVIEELRAAGCESLRAIAAGLEERGIPAARGGKWSTVPVSRPLEAASLTVMSPPIFQPGSTIKCQPPLPLRRDTPHGESLRCSISSVMAMRRRKTPTNRLAPAIGRGDALAARCRPLRPCRHWSSRPYHCR